MLVWLFLCCGLVFAAQFNGHGKGLLGLNLGAGINESVVSSFDY